MLCSIKSFGTQFLHLTATFIVMCTDVTDEIDFKISCVMLGLYLIVRC